MEVNNVSNSASTNFYASSTNKANNEVVEESTSTAVSTEKQEETTDVYERSQESGKAYKPDYNRIKELLAEQDSKVEGFRKLVESLLNKQAEKDKTANGGSSNTEDATGMWKGTPWENDKMIDIDADTRATAQKEIGEGGYYSVDETAKRLLDFAVAISGGDPSKIETLKGAVEKGFKKAADMWGGELPDISNDTYDAVMQGFDEWEKAGDSSAITLLNQNK